MDLENVASLSLVDIHYDFKIRFATEKYRTEDARRIREKL